MLNAMAGAGAQRVGFSPIHGTDDIRIEIASNRKYDVMLHVYGASSKTVAFRKDGIFFIGSVSRRSSVVPDVLILRMEFNQNKYVSL